MALSSIGVTTTLGTQVGRHYPEQLFSDGLTAKQIAVALGRSRAAIVKRLRGAQLFRYRRHDGLDL